MRRLLFCLYVFHFLQAQAQSVPASDSAVYALRNVQDSSRTYRLLDMARKEYGPNPAHALDLLAEALAHARKIQNLNATVRAYSAYIQFFTHVQPDLPKARAYLDSASGYEAHLWPSVKSDLFYSIGSYYVRNGELPAAYHVLVQAQRHNHHQRDNRVLGSMALLGYVSMILGKYDKARENFGWAYRQGQEAKAYAFAGAQLYNYAIVFQHESRYDSALFYLRELYRFELQHGNPHDNVLLLCAMGTSFLRLQLRDSARHYLHRAATAGRRLAHAEGTSEAYLALADFHLPHQIDSCLWYARAALRLPMSHDVYKRERQARLMNRAFASRQRFDSAYRYLLLYQNYRDSIQNTERARQVAVLDYDYQLERKDEEIGNLKQQQAWERTRRNLLGLALLLALLLLLGAGFFVRRVIRDKRQALAEGQAALQRYVRQLREKTMLMEEMSRQLMLVQERAVARQASSDLALAMSSPILTDDDWIEFKTIFDKVHSGFFYQLKSAFPDLTPAEIRLSALLKLRLSTREIAALLAISPESVSKTRYRLRKKLQLPAEEDLEGFIAEVTTGHKSIS